jgi:DNA-damage-inducible protein D
MQKKNNKAIAVFNGNKVRRHWDDEKELWFFSVIDVVEILTGSTIPRRYWSDLKIKLKNEGSQLYDKIVQLKFMANDGKYYEGDAADTETIFRIIQSIPSPKAEPFKRWLAKVGYERVQEIENPELSSKRMRLTYKLKGYSDEWIEMRMRGIAIREELTDEWKKRGAEHDKDYEILTAEISEATFGLKPNEYKKIKGLKRENLRDHMDDFELIFTMLGERATKEIHKTENSQGMLKLKSDAKAGGDIAGGARKNLEKRLGKSIVSKDNYLRKSQDKKLLK